MKSLLLSVATLALFSMPAFAQEQAIGEKAPMITAPMMGIDGNANTLRDLKGDKGLLVLVNSNEAKREGDDSLAAMKEHAKEAGYTMPYVVDEGSKLANACGARTTPHVYLYNSKLELAYRGSIDDNVNRSEEVKERYLHMAMQRMAEGKKIKTTETKAIGCSIKRILRK